MPSETLDVDAVCTMLDNSRRRLLILLVASEGEITTEEAANRIVQSELSTGSLSTKKRNSVYTALYQTHGPRLEDSGIVSFEEAGTMFRETALTGTIADHIWDIYETFDDGGERYEEVLPPDE